MSLRHYASAAARRVDIYASLHVTLRAFGEVAICASAAMLATLRCVILMLIWRAYYAMLMLMLFVCRSRCLCHAAIILALRLRFDAAPLIISLLLLRRRRHTGDVSYALAYAMRC